VSAWASRAGLSVGGGTGTAEPLEAMAAVLVEGQSAQCLFLHGTLVLLSRRVVGSVGDAEKALLGIDLWLAVWYQMQLVAAYAVRCEDTAFSGVLRAG
jgi:hypothetical protein